MGYQPPPGYPPHGYQQPPPGYPPPGYGYPQHPPPKKGMSTGGIVALIAIGLVGVLAVIGAAGGKKDAKKAETKGKDDATSVTVAELESAYADNEIKGDKLYKGKWLKISGEVASIDSGIGDSPIVHLKGKGLLGVSANDISKDAAADLKKGQKISLLCKGGGEVIGSPVLNDCTVTF